MEKYSPIFGVSSEEGIGSIVLTAIWLLVYRQLCELCVSTLATVCAVCCFCCVPAVLCPVCCVPCVFAA